MPGRHPLRRPAQHPVQRQGGHDEHDDHHHHDDDAGEHDNDDDEAATEAPPALNHGGRTQISSAISRPTGTVASMPTPTALLLFSAAALALLLVPGPAVLYITTRSASQGRRAGLVSVLGIHAATLIHVVAAVAGLSTVLATSALAFSAVKYAGAAYLITLGVLALAKGRKRSAAGLVVPRSTRRLFVDGFLVNLFNPKTALFFLAFLPQFVRPDGAPVWAQTLVLGLLFVCLGALSDSAYALASARVGRWLKSRPRSGERGPLVEGGVLVGLGVAALAVPHHRTA